jgi:hypothetical protein
MGVDQMALEEQYAVDLELVAIDRTFGFAFPLRV